MTVGSSHIVYDRNVMDGVSVCEAIRLSVRRAGTICRSRAGAESYTRFLTNSSWVLKQFWPTNGLFSYSGPNSKSGS